jgi:hypothetical protein
MSTANTTIDPARNPKVEHHIRKFLEALNSSGGEPLETLSPAEARAVLVNAQASVSLELPPCDIERKRVTEDGLNIDLTIVRPAGSHGISPAFMFFHGGGWILGDFPTHERFVRDLVVDSGFTSYLSTTLPRQRRNIRRPSTKPTLRRSGWPHMGARSMSMASAWLSWGTASEAT